MSNSERGTGRTQRGIILAVSQMLMGRNGIHLSATPHATRSACEYARSWLKSNGFLDQTTIPVATGSEVIRFGTATLAFLPMHASLRGMRADQIVKDHFVLECEEEAAAKKVRMDDAATIKSLMLKHKWHTVKLPVQLHPASSTLLVRG